jgi:hypothetical protein
MIEPKQPTEPASANMQERIARAICAETCAYVGEPACWTFTELPWPNPNCDEPGCQALAQVAALAARAASTAA